MPKQTQQTILITALKGRGFRPVETRSRKYQAFEDLAGDRVYFVGRGGALRIGRTVNSTDSISLKEHPLRAKLLQEGVRA